MRILYVCMFYVYILHMYTLIMSIVIPTVQAFDWLYQDKRRISIGLLVG